MIIYRNVMWKLSYHVTAQDNGRVNNKYDIGPAFYDIKNEVVVSNPIGQKYVLKDISITYRMTQAYTILLNRRIYNVDNVKFHYAVRQTLAKTLKGMD